MGISCQWSAMTCSSAASDAATTTWAFGSIAGSMSQLTCGVWARSTARRWLWDGSWRGLRARARARARAASIRRTCGPSTLVSLSQRHRVRAAWALAEGAPRDERAAQDTDACPHRNETTRMIRWSHMNCRPIIPARGAGVSRGPRNAYSARGSTAKRTGTGTPWTTNSATGPPVGRSSTE